MRSKNQKNARSSRRIGLFAPLLVLLMAMPAGAQERFELRVLGVGQSAAGDEIRLDGSGTTSAASFTLSDGTAVGLELEYRWRPRIAFELMAHFGGYDAAFELGPGAAGRASRGSLGSETYTLGVNYVLATPGRAEITAGAFGGFSYYDDITLTHPATGVPETFRFDDDLGFGVKLGGSLSLGVDGRWLAVGALRYQASILEGEVAGQDMDVDPLSLTLGIGYRF